MKQYIQTKAFECSGAHVQWVTLTLPQGNLASVGFQNDGYAQELYVNQMFVANSTTAFIQVHNSSLTTTKWWAWLVVDAPDKLGVSELRSQLQAEIQEKAAEPQR